jgi:hypothetical protein
VRIVKDEFTFVQVVMKPIFNLLLVIFFIITVTDKEGKQHRYHYEKEGDNRIEVYDENYNRVKHLRKEDGRWVEYDRDFNRLRVYDKGIIEEFIDEK